jgi:hypothetical protein
VSIPDDLKEAFGRLIAQTEDALAAGLSPKQVREAVRCGISSIEADISCAWDEEERDLTENRYTGMPSPREGEQ